MAIFLIVLHFALWVTAMTSFTSSTSSTSFYDQIIDYTFSEYDMMNTTDLSTDTSIVTVGDKTKCSSIVELRISVKGILVKAKFTIITHCAVELFAIETPVDGKSTSTSEDNTNAGNSQEMTSTTVTPLPWDTTQSTTSTTWPPRYTNIPTTEQTTRFNDYYYGGEDFYCGSHWYVFDYFENVPVNDSDPVGYIGNEAHYDISVKFEIVEDDASDVFFVDEIGTIWTLVELDREIVNHYTFTVNMSGEYLYKYVPVHVNVLDVNDNVPVWLQTTYATEVIDGTVEGSTMLVVSAVDADTDLNGRVKYNVTPPFHNHFEMMDNALMSTMQIVLDEMQQYRETEAAINDTITVTIEALNHDGQRATEDAYVEIKITRAVEAGFGNVSYQNAAVKENEPSGTYITTLKSITTVPEGYDILYEFAAKVDDIDIDQYTGNVTTATILDREDRDVYHYAVVGYLTDSTKCLANPVAEELLIRVLDDNDHYPVFTHNTSTGYVRENSSSAQIVSMVPQISTTDLDIGYNADIRYSLSGEGSDQFEIDPETGVITTTDELPQGLDREVTDEYHLFVTAADRNGDAQNLNTTVPIFIIVTDINDNEPVFYDEQPLPIDIYENVELNTNLSKVQADDNDAGLNGRVLYSIIGGSHGDFSINKRSGVLYVSGILDRESISSYVINISAYDTGNPILESYTVVTIDILDINDNGPVFSSDYYMAWINESSEIYTHVLNVSAEDIDQGHNAEITYSINSTDFVIDSNTEYESYDINYGFVEHTVTDFHIDASSVVAELYIGVSDENDNSPIFAASQYDGWINENSDPGVKVVLDTPISSVDYDYGLNASTVYTLSGDGHEQFKIDNKTGVITTTDDESVLDLDREERDRYNLEVIVSDRDGVDDLSLKTSVPLTVVLCDVNDNYPQFTQDEYDYEIPENTTIGHVIVVISTTDEDISVNAVAYTIVFGDDGKFNIGRNSGELTVESELDRELKPRYVLNVSASDVGSPELINYTRVDIHLTDINDNTPTFSPVEPCEEQAEEVAIGTTVLSVTATDDDEGENGAVQYSISDTESFTIDKDTGDITTISRLDYEDVQEYTFNVTATDCGEPPLSSTMSVSICITDINDNVPQFLNTPYNSNIQSNSKKNKFVISVTASDADDGDNGLVSYNITNDKNSLFTIDELNGNVFLAKDLDVNEVCESSLENCDVIFSAVASDNGHELNTNFAPVLVEIYFDENGTLKFEESQYEGGVNEEEVPPVYVTTVAVIGNHVVEYEFFNPVADFRINSSTGDIVTSTKLDRETTDWYSFTVTAKDTITSKHNAYVPVMVNVMDINDNAPMFELSKYDENYIDEGDYTDNHAWILNVSASDGDTGTNAEILYSIVSGDRGKHELLVSYCRVVDRSDSSEAVALLLIEHMPLDLALLSSERHFKINKTTGNIYSVGVIDRETINTYYLTVMVRGICK
ncbi:protocadherin Fat 4-like [Saccoglossus kowalevskii]